MNLPSNLLPSYSLRERNTLGFTVSAQMALPITTLSQIPEAIAYAKDQGLPYQVLGGGSNVVLPSQLLGLTLLMDMDVIEVIQNTDAGVQLRVAAGVNWHHFVGWTLDHGYGGLENLALIPGTVGAAPIQNIGAYGVEVKDYVEHVEAFDCESMQWVKLYQSDCQFSYRNSIFKTNPSRYVISTVVFNLPHTWQPRITYADLQSYFVNRSIDSIAPKDIFTAVCAIRSQKLPDPKVIGNVGSFFQNPIVENSKLTELKQRYPAIVAYPENANHSKLAAGWLIDQCGFKGLRAGNVGVHDKQALVLINLGKGNARELLALAHQIQETIRDRFGVDLVIEPIIFS
jgi:UDP-N-acetylmuramate dehydrogenase